MSKLINVSLLLCVVLGLTSCLKDDTIIGPDSPGAVKNVVEFKNPALPSSGTSDKMPFYVMSFDISPSSELAITVSYSGADAAPNDVVVNVELNNPAIETVNNEQGLSLTPLPADLYSIPSLTVTIPKGERTATIPISLKTDKFDLTKSYALGFKIASVSGTNAPISGNYGTIVVAVGAKNKYDGVYHVTGSLTDLASSTITGYYPLTWELQTSGPNSVLVVDNEFLGSPGHIIQSGTSLSYYGSFGLVVTFDPTTNKITKLVNYYGQPASNGRSAALDPTGRNEYDPATKKIYIKYFMLQPGTTVRTAFDEVWTFVNPR